ALQVLLFRQNGDVAVVEKKILIQPVGQVFGAVGVGLPAGQHMKADPVAHGFGGAVAGEQALDLLVPGHVVGHAGVGVEEVVGDDDEVVPRLLAGARHVRSAHAGAAAGFGGVQVHLHVKTLISHVHILSASTETSI